MQLSVRNNIDFTLRNLDKQHKRQVPFAIKNTVNKLAVNTKKTTDTQILRRIDRPKNYTKRMMRVGFAKKTNLVARVAVKDSATVTKRGFRGPDQILGHLFSGGTRQLKGMEVLLRRAKILPANRYIVPGQGAPLDRHGNIKTGVINQVLAYTRAFQESGFRANAVDKKGRDALAKRFARAQSSRVAQAGQFFVVKKKTLTGLHPGIWARFKFASGSSIKPIMMFVRKPVYRRVFNLPKTANRVIVKQLDRTFDTEIRKAISTAR